MSVRVEHGDCLDVMATLAAEGVTVDAIVTDPPYHLTSIVKRFGADNAAPAKVGQTGAYARASAGFMGKKWDGGDVAFRPETWRLAFDLLKPGGHLIAFGGTRTYHRLACAIEDAGFEIRDQLQWLFGSGFPKSHDVSKAIDKAAGAEREVVGKRQFADGTLARDGAVMGQHGVYGSAAGNPLVTAPATDAAKQWQGWGTALKPSNEPVVFAQKPSVFSSEWVTIRNHLDLLKARLWLLLPASIAEQNSALNPNDCAGDEFDGAQWTVEERNNTRAALCDQMDTSQFALATITSLSTVSSWNDTLAEVWAAANTSTIETASSTTTDLKTWNYCLSEITPADIIQAHKRGRWLNADACPAARYFNATVAGLSATLEHSAVAPVIEPWLQACLDGDAPKPLDRPIVLARKPLSEGSVAANVLKHGAGAVNVDGCRVEGQMDGVWGSSNATVSRDRTFNASPTMGGYESKPHQAGRWPANVVHDGSDEVLAAFAVHGDGKGAGGPASGPTLRNGSASVARGKFNGLPEDQQPAFHGDTGTAARFFYSAKADATDRLGSKHPTVKPVDLMRWLVRLVTPQKGTVLDPFAGTGTTGMACLAEGFDAILIEREAEYVADIERRIAHVSGGDTPLFAPVSEGSP